MPKTTLDRRSLVRRLGGTLVLLALGRSPLRALSRGAPDPFPTGEHPDPRPDVDGSRVLGAQRVGPQLAELFDQVRAIPGVVDGVRCHCGCAEVEGMYSLLSCYEGAGMAQYCQICQGEGRLVVRLEREGRSLDEIREAIDRRFG